MAESNNDKSNWKKAFKKFYDDFKQAEEGSDSRDSTSVDSYSANEKNVTYAQSIEPLLKEKNNSFNNNLSEALVNRPSRKIQCNKVPLKNVDYSIMNIKATSSCTDYNSSFTHSYSNAFDIALKASKQNKKKQNYNQKNESVEVPEWNKVFKQILGSDTSAIKKHNVQDTIKIETNEPEYDSSVKPKSKPFKIPTKVFEDEEEDDSEEDDDNDPLKEAKALFARARLFKRPHVYRINDFEGMGINCFKDDKPLSYWAAAVPSKDRKKNYVPDIPLTGCVAPYNPITPENVHASYIPFDEEAWDDDLLI